MLRTVLSLVALVVIVAAFIALWLWTRRIESDTAFAQSEGIKTAEQADTLRFGIAMTVNQNNIGL